MRRLLTLVSLPLAMACGPAEPEPEPEPEPSLEVCDAITTERDCFDAGCSFFVSATPITPVAEVCDEGASFGVCLFSTNPDGPPTLNYYTRERDGQTLALQLGFDVTIEGWSECSGAASIQDACACAE